MAVSAASCRGCTCFLTGDDADIKLLLSIKAELKADLQQRARVNKHDCGFAVLTDNPNAFARAPGEAAGDRERFAGHGAPGEDPGHGVQQRRHVQRTGRVARR